MSDTGKALVFCRSYRPVTRPVLRPGSDRTRTRRRICTPPCVFALHPNPHQPPRTVGQSAQFGLAKVLSREMWQLRAAMMASRIQSGSGHGIVAGGDGGITSGVHRNIFILLDKISIGDGFLPARPVSWTQIFLPTTFIKLRGSPKAGPVCTTARQANQSSRSRRPPNRKRPAQARANPPMKEWYRRPGSNGGPLDPQSSALTN